MVPCNIVTVHFNKTVTCKLRRCGHGLAKEINTCIKRDMPSDSECSYILSVGVTTGNATIKMLQ